jgi:hypothetical protein
MEEKFRKTDRKGQAPERRRKRHEGMKKGGADLPPFSLILFRA